MIWRLLKFSPVTFTTDSYCSIENGKRLKVAGEMINMLLPGRRLYGTCFTVMSQVEEYGPLDLSPCLQF